MSGGRTLAPRAPLREPVAPAVPYSREDSLARLGPELMADIAAKVAAAPAPSPRKVEEIRRLFAATPAPQQ